MRGISMGFVGPSGQTIRVQGATSSAKIKKEPRYAYCTSMQCLLEKKDISGLRYLAPFYIFKPYAMDNAIDCPDCGEVLFWTSKMKRTAL